MSESRKKGREMYTEHIKKSIQFNNKDVHLNKRINEAKNSMKCDAIHHHTAVAAEKIVNSLPFQFLKKKSLSVLTLWCNAT
jgi:hypothetical protein